MKYLIEIIVNGISLGKRGLQSPNNVAKDIVTKAAPELYVNTDPERVEVYDTCWGEWTVLEDEFVTDKSKIRIIYETDESQQSHDKEVSLDVFCPKQTSTPNKLEMRVTKGQLFKLARTCSTAQTLLDRWNNINSIVRGKVSEKDWKGTKAFRSCDGSTDTDIAHNITLREEIVNDMRVHNGRHPLPGTSLCCVFDASMVRRHVMTVINEAKRSKRKRKGEKEDEHLSQTTAATVDSENIEGEFPSPQVARVSEKQHTVQEVFPSPQVARVSEKQHTQHTVQVHKEKLHGSRKLKEQKENQCSVSRKKKTKQRLTTSQVHAELDVNSDPDLEKVSGSETDDDEEYDPRCSNLSMLKTLQTRNSNTVQRQKQETGNKKPNYNKAKVTSIQHATVLTKVFLDCVTSAEITVDKMKYAAEEYNFKFSKRNPTKSEALLQFSNFLLEEDLVSVDCNLQETVILRSNDVQKLAF